MTPEKKTPRKPGAAAKKSPPVPRTDSEVMTALNQAESAGELVKALGLAKSATAGAEAIMAHRATLARGAFVSAEQLHAAVASNPAHASIIDAIRGSGGFAVEKLPLERMHFNQLLLTNPNYFGNLTESPFKPVKNIKGNTTYESMDCVGLNPPFDRLEAVIKVKKNSGYGGDICSNGSREYVRFYVDLADNGTWVDVGFSQVRVYNIPGFKPLCYAVSHKFDPDLKLCFVENIVKIRAILSWNSVPPANSPNFVPVWGERRDVEVQIRPRKFIIIDDFIEAIPVENPILPVLKSVELGAQAAEVPTQEITLAQKKALYKKTKVEVSRYAFTEATALTKSAGATAFSAPGTLALEQLGLTKVEIGKLFDDLQIIPVDGNTNYEEMTCIGYDPGKKLLQAIIHVKRSTGFSGSLCTNGSTEYVAFWANFGAGYDYLGTATVKVHDLQTIPAGGVYYAADLKVDLSQYEIPCTSGARTPRLRAILSWQAPPPPNNPNYIPTWGNREECRIQLIPGPAIQHVPLIETVGDIARQDIDQISGMADGPMVIGSGQAVAAPFGGKVTITGRIGAPPDAFGGPDAPFKYRVRVSDDAGASWETLSNNVVVNISEWLNGVPQPCAPGDFVCSTTLTATDDLDGLGGGWYTYLEDTILPWTRGLVVDKLAEWHTGDREGLWTIELTAKDGNGNILGTDFCNVLLDNTAPSVAPPAPDDPDAALRLAISHFVVDGETFPSHDCGHIPVGAVIHGTYEVADPAINYPGQHMGAFSLSVLPTLSPPNPGGPVPASKSFPVLSTNGEAGNWTLDTTGWEACGYVIQLWARDRTVVNSSYIGWRRTKDVGFCLVD